MNWAARRRFIILLIIGAIVVAFFATVLIATFSKTPTCSDNIQNQDETGVDCGGSCAYLCSEQQRPPTVLFTKAISNGKGRTDVVASIENVNASAAARNVPYTVMLYGARQAFVQEVTGTIDLPPFATIPIYIPGIPSGNQDVVRAFFSIDPASPQWFAMANDMRAKPVVSNTIMSGTASAPRIDATLTNGGVTALSNVRVIILVRDAQGEVMTASQTIVPAISAQGQATATFTWNTAFPNVPATIEVLPVIPLP